MKAIAPLNTLIQSVFTHLFDFKISMNTFLSHLTDWGKTASDFMSLVGTSAQWD